MVLFPILLAHCVVCIELYNSLTFNHSAYFSVALLCSCRDRSSISGKHLTTPGPAGNDKPWIDLARNHVTHDLQSQRAETEGKGSD